MRSDTAQNLDLGTRIFQKLWFEAGPQCFKIALLRFESPPLANQGKIVHPSKNVFKPHISR